MKMKDICLINTVYDHILVGQGLAGSCLALQLMKRGKKILVYDQPQDNRASAIAAGLFNPITGRFLKQSWMAEKIFPQLLQFYKEAEVLLRQRFFYPMPIYRPFTSIEEQNEWMAASEKKLLQPFIEKIHTSSLPDQQVHDPFGGVVTRHSGYLDTKGFINGVRDFLTTREAYRENIFDPERLSIHPGEINYKSHAAANIIFCEGVGSMANRFFNWVPIRPLKGETLTVLLKEQPEVIFNRGVYIVPTQTKHEYLVGATYTPADTSREITQSGRAALEEKLNELITTPFTVNHHNWGIRPTTLDRRPILGRHPEFKNLIIFNGLGTKGVSLAPYFSGVLSDWLAGQGEIPFEVNIERFKSLYSKFSSAII